jgi:hypothetical protein
MAQATSAQETSVQSRMPADAIERRYGQTHRKDRWWVEPVLVGSGLGIFVLYSLVSALLLGGVFEVEGGPYLSPFFEPLIRPDGLPQWFSPAIFILWAPLGFRTTCYYYRRAYYRSYFLSPPACAVGEPAKSYSGEAWFPLVLQNSHRWFMYVALLFIPILWTGAIQSFWLDGEGLGIGLGSVILVTNAFLLTMYTVGCHSLRYWVAGGVSSFSGSASKRLRRKLWEGITVANVRHRFWAWTSLISVGVADLYIRLVVNDVIPDPNTWTNF